MIAHFNASFTEDGLPHVRLEFPIGCSPTVISRESKRVMTEMVGEGLLNSEWREGDRPSVHVLYNGCCAEVSIQPNIDGSCDMVWLFHRSPPEGSGLAQLLAGGANKKAGN